MYKSHDYYTNHIEFIQRYVDDMTGRFEVTTPLKHKLHFCMFRFPENLRFDCHLYSVILYIRYSTGVMRWSFVQSLQNYS